MSDSRLLAGDNIRTKASGVSCHVLFMICELFLTSDLCAWLLVLTATLWVSAFGRRPEGIGQSCGRMPQKTSFSSPEWRFEEASDCGLDACKDFFLLEKKNRKEMKLSKSKEKSLLKIIGWFCQG